MQEFKIETHDGKADVYTPYNEVFIYEVKRLGGRWNSDDKCWTVNEKAVEDVRNLMQDIFGRDDQPVGETVDVELTFTEDVSQVRGTVDIYGRVIASASGKLSGARQGPDVMFMEGEVKSGGTNQYWETIVCKGAVVKMLSVPKRIVEKERLPYGVKKTILSMNNDLEALKQEKQRLLTRIAEIDSLLGSSSKETSV